MMAGKLWNFLLLSVVISTSTSLYPTCCYALVIHPSVFAMASNHIKSDEVPLVILVRDEGYLRIPTNILYIHFGIAVTSSMLTKQALKHMIVKEKVERDSHASWM